MEITRSPQIAEHVDPLLTDDPEGIVGPKGFGDAVCRLPFLFLEGFEQPVPNDEYATEIFVNVLIVISVMNTVM